MELFLLGFFSVLVGLIIGATGVGGVLLIPLLAYLGALSMHGAMATALFSFFFTGVAATALYQRHGSIDWKITMPVCAGSLVTAYLGAYVNAMVAGWALSLILAVIVIGSSLYSMYPLRGTRLTERISQRGQNILLLAVGLFVGFLCGLTGIGGGLISIPVMLILGWGPLVSIATGQVLQLIVAVSGSISNISNGFVDFELVWWVTLLELVGVFIGVRIAHRVPVASLKKAVSLFCLAIGLYMLVRSFI